MTHDAYLSAFLAHRAVGNLTLGVIPLTFGRARVVYGPTDEPEFIDGW